MIRKIAKSVPFKSHWRHGPLTTPGPKSLRLKTPTYTGEKIYVNGEEIDLDALMGKAHANNYKGDQFLGIALRLDGPLAEKPETI